MIDKQYFEVRGDHLDLLDHIWFGYNDWTEFGAPEVDPKRPYGNSSVYEDIGEILGIEPGSEPDRYGDREFTQEQKDYMLQTHKEMQHVLQILASTRSIEVGKYEKEKYGVKWVKS